MEELTLEQMDEEELQQHIQELKLQLETAQEIIDKQVSALEDIESITRGAR